MMVSLPVDQPDPQEPTGVLGDGALHPGKYNMALMRRAIREDWPISAEVRKSVVEQMAKVVELSTEERNKIAASKVLITADTVNAKREAMDQAELHHAEGEHVYHEHGGIISVEQRRAELFTILDSIGERSGIKPHSGTSNGHANGNGHSNGNGPILPT